MKLAEVVKEIVGEPKTIAIECFDGSRIGPSDAETKIIVKRAEAINRILWAPGELGFARAWVADDIAIQGNIFDSFTLRDQFPNPSVSLKQWIALARLLKITKFRKLSSPPEELILHGSFHSRKRDKESVSLHYDISNEFYKLILGPALTYSCAVWENRTTTLVDAQRNKHDLICKKLDLKPGMRLLEVGCGWGSMAIHAAKNYDVEVVGITISEQQADLAQKRVSEAGFADRIEIRVQDYREIKDDRFDAISSIGMFEHVGEKQLEVYFTKMFSVLKPRGRFLNHGITRPDGSSPRLAKKGFINRYVFPDGELHELGRVISRIQKTGFEVRHCENLREHYNLTLRSWVKNLENNWDEAVEHVGLARAKIWLLYMAGSAESFAKNRTHIHQILTIKPDVNGFGTSKAQAPHW